MAARSYSVRLVLTSIDDLFRAPDITPFDPRYGDHSRSSALDFIADEVYANGSYRSARAEFVVPEGDRVDEEAAREAVARWSSARARSTFHDVQATRWRGTRSLVSGVVLFVLLIALAKIVGDGDDLVGTLAKGLEVAAWVVLWFPVDTLVWSLWQHRLDRRSYAVIRDMEISIVTAPESPATANIERR